eukprot:CAMPEP_0198112354 /NCGR_PEP_ID=MMETSP1442-20131203/4217_1 /TAXON_ID= /ORGANISM="Craspedostauros australis, Strain CCMP3328" /LENGTH=49 /DNA_ID=CAMNT_0043769089 /DNA_START=488 /DNA_END=637 /DNA_ORIENTATION=-
MHRTAHGMGTDIQKQNSNPNATRMCVCIRGWRIFQIASYHNAGALMVRT